MNTIEEIAQDVFANMDDEDKAFIKAQPSANDMYRFHHGAGTAIRNKYLHPNPGHPLTQDAHPDDVSHEILKRVWELCQ